MRLRSTCALSLIVAACGGERPVTLLVATELPDGLRDHAEASFEAIHSDVDVRFVERSGAEALASLGGVEGEGGAAFDVWWGADAALLEEATDAGHLLAYRPTWLDEPTLVETRSEDAWHPVLVTPFVVAFSRDELELTRAPTDWNDLRHFRWSEEIEMLDPARSVAGAWLVGSILQRHRVEGDLDRGFEWLQALDGQVSRYVTTPAQAIRALETGSARLALLPRADVEAARADAAAWLYYRFPESGTPMLVRGIAVVARTESEDAARAFIDHVGSKDVRTVAKLETRWQPAYGGVDSDRVPPDFELPHSWRPYEIATRAVMADLPGWLDRWETEVRGR